MKVYIFLKEMTQGILQVQQIAAAKINEFYEIGGKKRDFDLLPRGPRKEYIFQILLQSNL